MKFNMNVDCHIRKGLAFRFSSFMVRLSAPALLAFSDLYLYLLLLPN